MQEFQPPARNTFEHQITRGFTSLAATVHPDNAPSLRNFQKAGYHILQESHFYGGQRRYLACKTFPPT